MKNSLFVYATLFFVSTGLLNEYIIESGVSVGFFLMIPSDKVSTTQMLIQKFSLAGAHI